MPQWKKVAISGSNISQFNNDANFVTTTDSDPLTGSLVSKGFQAIGQEHTIGGTDIQEDTTSINVSSSAIVTPSRASTNPYNNYFGNNGNPLGVQGFKFLPQSTPQRLQSYRFNSSENKTNILLNAGFAGDATSTFHQLKTGSAFEVFGLNTGTKADGFNPFGGGFNELYTGLGNYNNLTIPDKLPPYASDNTPGVGMTIGGINHDQTNSQTTSSFYQAELLCYPGKNYRNSVQANKWSSYQSGLSINLLSSKGGTATSIKMHEALRITDQYVYVPGHISASGDLFVDTLTTAGEVTFKGPKTKFETTIIGASPIGVDDTFIITGSRQNRTGSFTNPAIIASGSTALNTIGSLKFESLTSTTETTGLVINSSDVVSKRAFGVNAFTDTTIPTAVTDLSDVTSAGSGIIITAAERTAIGTNTSGISTNTSDISTNTTNISGKLAKASNLSDLNNAGTARTNIGLGNVDNKSSSTIRGEITSANVTTALGFTPTANTGTLTGNGTSGRVPIYDGTTSFTTDSGFTYSSNKLGIDGVITSNTKDIISNASSATTLIIGDVAGNDSIEQLDLKAMSYTAISITDSQVEFTNDIGIKISNAPDTTTEDTALMIAGTGAVQKRNLGSNAFNSTAIPTAVTNLSDVSSAGSGQIITAAERTAIGTNTSGISTNTSNIANNSLSITNKAASGANSDITSLTGLTTALSVAQGGTGATALDSIQLSSFDDDLDNTYVALSGAQTISGTKTFSVAQKFSTGTVSAPSISFNSNNTYTTGFYLSNPHELSISRAGVQNFKFDSNGFQSLNSGTSQFTGHLQAHCLGIGIAPSQTSGEIWASGDVVANKSSDRRLKKKIKNIPNALEKVSQINGVTFEWKKTNEKMKKEVHSHEGQDVGVIAQEIEEVLPEIVATRDNGYKAVYYEKLVPLLIEAVKELKAEVDELKKSK